MTFMTTSKKLLTMGVSLTALLTLQACGGGSSSPAVTPPPTAAVPPTPPVSSAPTVRTVVGPISGFGSIILNGVRYDTNSASFSIDGTAGTQADLNVGQIIVLKAETDSAGNPVASSVDYEEILEGPISSIDTANESLVILGQTVLINNLTSFDSDISPASIDGLIVGDIVEISGEFNAAGEIVATRLDKSDDQSSNNEFEVHGVVTNLDTAAQTFNLGTLSVGFASASLEDFGANGIANGDFVEVEGTTFLNDGTLVATSVENENDDRDEREGDEDGEAEISGLITSFTSAQLFEVAGITVITNGSTEFEDGTAANLGLNVNVEVEGTFNAAGELVAEEVEFEVESEIEISSTIEAIDTANNTLTVSGVTFTVDALTRFEDNESGASQTFSLANLAVGDFVEITAFENSSGDLIASSIEREDGDGDNDNETEIEAPVSQVGTDSLVLLGITIETNASTEYELEIDDDEQTVSAQTFFSTVMVGDIVEAEGRFTSSTTFLANELSLEDDD